MTDLYFKTVRMALALIYFLTTVSAFSLAPDPEKIKYWEAVVNAIESQNLGQIKALLDHPPAGETKPLSPANGHLLFAMYELLLSQNETMHVQEVYRFLDRALQLGANAIGLVPVQGLDKNIPIRLHITTLDWILHNLPGLLAENPIKADQDLIYDRTFEFLKRILGSKEVGYDYQVLFVNGPDHREWQRVNLLQYSIIIKNSRLRDFLVDKVGPGVLDENGFNTPIWAAMIGDLDTLKKLRDTWGPEITAKAFNFRVSKRFNPTVLHMAIQAIAQGKPATTAIAVLEYLTKNGADPSQRSMFHDLIDEVNFWLPQLPQRAQDELLVVRTYLKNNLKRLHDQFLVSMKTQGLNCNQLPRKL